MDKKRGYWTPFLPCDLPAKSCAASKRQRNGIAIGNSVSFLF